MALKGFIEVHRMSDNQAITISLNSIEKFSPMVTGSGGYYTELFVATGNGPREKYQLSETYENVKSLIEQAQEIS
jgi:hypothetical protein